MRERPVSFGANKKRREGLRAEFRSQHPCMRRWRARMAFASWQASLARRASVLASVNATGFRVPTSSFSRVVVAKTREAEADTCTSRLLRISQKLLRGRVGTTSSPNPCLWCWRFTASAAESFRSRCGSVRSPPLCSSQGSPSRAPRVRNRTATSGLGRVPWPSYC